MNKNETPFQEVTEEQYIAFELNAEKIWEKWLSVCGINSTWFEGQTPNIIGSSVAAQEIYEKPVDGYGDRKIILRLVRKDLLHMCEL